MDDLFGDLPAAKNTPAHNPSSHVAAAVAVASKDTSAASDAIPTPPASKTTTKEEPKSKSLVSSLGTAGTSMAFVPQALRKKKRPTINNQMDKKQRVNNIVNMQEAVLDQLPTNASINVMSKQTQEGDTHIPIGIDIPKQSTILHDNNTQEPSDTDEPYSEPYLENEPPSLQALHESAKLNPYNPHTPNDYLSYRERKKTEAIKLDLQAMALAKIQATEALRVKISEERSKIEAEGDLDKIVASRSMGRGRGRGLSNLPAWLVKKQQEQQRSGGGTNDGAVTEGQFDDDGCNTTTISLLNMVTPDEIDPELKEEVREECVKFGVVTRVDVIVDDTAVRVDVTFESRASAERALKVFDGRMFGDRKIRARFS
ncbi:hypothetical protein ACHAWO_011045 [Cyclotella atomus]|jgi:hypothetical protein|uniref:RRM domain-containing protein n=1 Tax=Cyclotella atomus TaxID=382360 RepID=A0ABD3N1E9_9STRA